MKICCVFNIAPLYRSAIYELLDRDDQLAVDFYFGDDSAEGIALLDPHRLQGFRGSLKNRYRGKKLVWQRGWWRALRGGYDAYILTGNPGIRSNWLLILLLRLRGKKVYLWSHGPSGAEGKWGRWVGRIYARLAGRLLLYGTWGRDLLIAAGHDPQKLTVIYNSLDYDRFRELRGHSQDPTFFRNYFGNNDPVVVFVGRLTRGKRLDLLLEATAGLLTAGTPCNVMLIGDGEAETALRAQTQAAGLTDRVWFYGACYDPEYLALVFQHATLCVSPGNVGLTAIHALSFGVPVITHDERSAQGPEVEAIESGLIGDLFCQGASLDLQHKMEMWLERLRDPRLKAETQRACYARIDAVYNPHYQLELFRKIFQ